ncbi:hypothetical protein HZY86_04640 [Aerococcaceae bacterium DSM 111020]|nr:hypothetical protein [Aerococcaceae bacterium DSM 111020]
MTHTNMSLFPINYFQTMVSPTKIFKHRQYLSAFQSTVVMIFLHALLMMPVSLQLATLDQVDLSVYFPTIVAEIDNTIVRELEEAYQSNQTHIIKNESDFYLAFQTDDSVNTNGIEQANYLVITPTELYLGESSDWKLSVNNEELVATEDAQTIINQLSFAFMEQNRLPIFVTSLLNISLLVFLHLIMLIFGTSFILSLMKHATQYDIQGFKQAFQIVLNALGLPTVISSSLGLLSLDVTLMLTMQGLFFLLILSLSYWKTHFNDRYTEKQLKRNKRTDEKEVF